ncbi:SGNH/GDSL hydrolase family protein [Ancylobacter amanitiformis]|uniref:SGNH hydrolase-type esterase domain-containing protein n=1 Tax=Ancylobacter amanitiformis TaxID=217069 RepID=A0ABU0LPE4_9HYPH|nr:GDSL-type esterase/lipase family protein [Ancylobacter amanitiformis]MDQ0510528.1 hypothetical protein [Ancylobacter amanitiformis]
MRARGFGQGRGIRQAFRTFLAGALLSALLSVGNLPAQAQSDWFRPPGDVGQPAARPAPQRQAPARQQQPTRQQQQPSRQFQSQQRQQARQAPPAAPRSWSPFQPLIDLFRGDSPPRAVAPRVPRDAAPAPPVARAPVIAPPAEPRGAVYDNAAAARADAKVSEIVLVLGDDYAASLAQGLADAFAADREGVVVVGKSEAGSGLGPGSPFDWLSTARQLPAGEQANVTVLFAGANDLVPIEDPAGRAEPLDERWREIYGRRLDDVLLGLKLAGRPVVVVGLPPVEDDAANQRRTQFNVLLKEHVERAGLIFVDVTDGFVDENGKFMMSGPAVDGQRRRLRSSDGLGFTRAGGRKLAFFVDRELDDLLARPGEPPAAAANPADARPSIILLTGGAVSGARTLAGAPGAAPLAAGGAAASAVVTPVGQEGVAEATPEPARVLVSGAALPAVTGRTDDFRWPVGQPAATSAPLVGPMPDDAPLPTIAAPDTPASGTGSTAVAP